MRKILYTLCIIAGGVGTVAALISGHLMEDQRRHIAYWWLLLCIPLTLLGLIPTIVNVWREPHPGKTAKLQRVRRDERRAFGVYWDSDLNPLCPACGTPLTLSRDKLIYRIDGGVPLPLPEPHCFSCDKLVPLHDDDGNHITLSEAKKLLSPKEAKTEIEFPKQQPLQLQTSDAPQTPEPNTYQPDDIDKKIISYLCREGVDRLPRFIARFVGVGVIDIEIRLHHLISNGYIRRPRTRSTKPFAHYGVTADVWTHL